MNKWKPNFDTIHRQWLIANSKSNTGKTQFLSKEQAMHAIWLSSNQCNATLLCKKCKSLDCKLKLMKYVQPLCLPFINLQLHLLYFKCSEYQNTEFCLVGPLRQKKFKDGVKIHYSILLLPTQMSSSSCARHCTKITFYSKILYFSLEGTWCKATWPS